MADDPKPLGGSLIALLAGADTILDEWITHAKKTGANTPELMLMLLINKDMETPQIGRETAVIVMLATAIQRLIK